MPTALVSYPVLAEVQRHQVEFAFGEVGQLFVGDGVMGCMRTNIQRTKARVPCLLAASSLLAMCLSTQSMLTDEMFFYPAFSIQYPGGIRLVHVPFGFS